jgi:hypothetical protein
MSHLEVLRGFIGMPGKAPCSLSDLFSLLGTPWGFKNPIGAPHHRFLGHRHGILARTMGGPAEGGEPEELGS